MDRHRAALLTEAVLAQLDPDETPYAAVVATHLPGHNGIGRDEAPKPRISFDPDPIAGGLDLDPDWTDAALGGVNAGGAPASIADRFARELGSHHCTLVLTDRRLALTRDVAPLLSSTVDQRVTVSVERRQVVAIIGAPRILQQGRVRITFADGSWVMAMTGMISSRAARRLISAFQAGC